MSDNTSSGLFGLNFGFPIIAAETEKPLEPTGGAVFGSGFGVDTTTGRNSAEFSSEPQSGLNIFGLGFGFDAGTNVEPTTSSTGNTQSNGVNIFGIDFGSKPAEAPSAERPARKPSMFLGMDLSVIGIELPESGTSNVEVSTPSSPSKSVAASSTSNSNTALFGIDFSDPFKLKASEPTATAPVVVPTATPSAPPAKRQSIFLGVDFAPMGLDFGDASATTTSTVPPPPAATPTVAPSTPQASTSAPTTPAKAASNGSTPARGEGMAKQSSVFLGIDLSAMGMDFQNNSTPMRAESPPMTPPENIAVPPSDVHFSPAPNSSLAFLNFGSQSMDLFDAMKSPIGRR